MQKALVILTALTFALSGRLARAESNPTKEFIMSCTYGVLAGTLVGAASLAFVKKPGDNMNKVARGASFGLYTGILLGLYSIYIIPALEDDSEDPVAQMPFLLEPLFAGNELDGLKANLQVLSF